MVAGEWLDCQMNPLVSLQVMVAVETLWALVALEGSVICGRLLVGRVAEKMRHCRSVTAVEARHHSRVYAYQRHLTVRVLHVGENWRRTRLIS
jgi:hypothetical protein